MEQVTVAVGIPHLGNLPGFFFDSFISLDKVGQPLSIRVENKPVDIARNRIVETALKYPAVTHLFFMDSDMRFPPESLRRLLERDLPIVSGTYFARGDTPVPHAYKYAHHDANGVGWYRAMAKEFVKEEGEHVAILERWIEREWAQRSAAAE